MRDKNKSDNYFIAVYENAEVIKLTSEERKQVPDKDICYLICSEFERFSSSRKTMYFNNYIYNTANEQLKNNEFRWRGIKCRLRVSERWEKIKEPNSFGVSLSAVIWDKIQNKQIFKYKNNHHNGSAFQALFSDLQSLAECESLKAFEIINKKDKEIRKLRNKSNS